MQVPLVAFGIWLASERAGVHDTEVAVVLVAIVPLVFPKEYVSVCVKAEEARLIEIVPADPIVIFAADTLEARGMLSSVILALAVIVPYERISKSLTVRFASSTLLRIAHILSRLG